MTPVGWLQHPTAKALLTTAPTLEVWILRVLAPIDGNGNPPGVSGLLIVRSPSVYWLGEHISGARLVRRRATGLMFVTECLRF